MLGLMAPSTAPPGDGRRPPSTDAVEPSGELVDPGTEAAFRRKILIEANDAVRARLLARANPPADVSDA